MPEELVHKELSEKIIGAAMKVLNTLKPGLDEKLYERALVIELRKQGLLVETQRAFDVFYDENLIGSLVPDLLVEGKVVVDTKCVLQFNEHHVVKMIGYLTITGFQLALLLNFKFHKLGWKRVVQSS